MKTTGKVEYVVTAVNVSGSVEKYIFYNIKDLNTFVNEINSDTYWSVQKIEKFKRYDFIYEKEILQSPLFFQLEGVTETDTINNQTYSFLLKDKSLLNIKRIKSKNK